MGLSMAKEKTQRLVLIVAALCLMLTGVDVTAVNLILSPMAMEFNISMSDIQWVTNAYVLISSVLIIAGGRLGDIYGKKQVLLFGLVGFLIGSMLITFSHAFLLLIVGRLIQGASAALIAPNVMAMVYQYYPNEKKGYVSGVLTSVMSISFGLGPFLGGFFSEVYSWRLVFLINIPIIAMVLGILSFCVDLDGNRQRGRSIASLNIWGLVTLGGFLFFLISLINQLDHLENSYHQFLFFGMGACVFLILFFYSEKWAINPVFHVELFSQPVIFVSCILRFLLGIPMAAFTFMFALYLQRVSGYSSLEAGLLVLPFAGSMVLVAPFTGRLVDRIGYIVPLTTGVIVCIFSFAFFAVIGAEASIFEYLILFISVGAGLGLTRPGLITAIMKHTPDSHLGLMNSVSSMLNSVGGAIGIALTSTTIGFFSFEQDRTALILSLPWLMYASIMIFLVILLFIYFGLHARSSIEYVAK